MSFIKKINDPSGKVYDDISVGALTFDTEPIPGSFNAVTSDGVANAIGAILPGGTSQDNPLMNAEDTERMIAEMMPIAENTLRFEFSKKDYNPTIAEVGTSGTWKKVSKYANIWDWTKNDTSFSAAFQNAFTDSDNLVSVLSCGDTSSVTSISSMFNGCTSLVSIPLFDTSSVMYMNNTFKDCTSLVSIPLFDTSSVASMNDTFNGCLAVTGGALALYQQVSAQATPPASHIDTFKNCGANTTTGAAELAQIPASWGGTAV